MRAPHPLIDRQMLEKLERLAVRWQTSFTGLLGGHNRSRFAGTGQEFLDHRHFHPGDDVRSVNWLAYMRLERLFLKMFQIEPRVPVRMFLDTSESMACGADAGKEGEAKFAYACRLAAMLTYVGLVRLDTIVLQPFAASLAESYAAQGGRHRFAPALDFLSKLETGGRSDFQAATRQFLSADPARGLIIVISDFLDEADAGCEAALQHIADFGHELLLVHLAGPDDQQPAWRGELEMVDSESGATRLLTLDERAMETYAAAWGEFCLGLQHLALRNGGRYVPMVTATPIDEAVFRALLQSGGVGLR